MSVSFLLNGQVPTKFRNRLCSGRGPPDIWPKARLARGGKLLLAKLAVARASSMNGYKDSSNLARAAEHSWPLAVDFSDDAAEDWPVADQTFQMRHLANTSDAATRTFDFFVPLVNQFRTYEKNNRRFVLWRYRPGQRVRIQVPVKELRDVFVLPTEAAVLEGPEASVFQQNGDLFHRISVQVVHQDRLNVIVANDGALLLGFYLPQNAAASLNRVLKSQAASGMRSDVHVHADGSVHAAH